MKSFIWALLVLCVFSEPVLAQRDFIQSSRARKMHRHHLDEVVLKFNNDEVGHAWVSHQGKPKLLLLHGITGNAEVQYTRNAAKLSKFYDVIALDLKFHGEAHNLPQGYAIEDQVHWVAECLMLLSQQYSDDSYQRVHVLGNSYGGIVAGIFADHYPHMVTQLTMVDAPIRFFGTSMADSIAHAAGVKDFFDLLSPTTAEVFKSRTKLSLHKKIWIPKFVAQQIIENDLMPRREDHLKLVQSLKESELYWNNYEFKWRFKVNIIWGDADHLIPLQVGRKQAAYFKNASYTELSKVGHVWNMERPRQFNQWLIKKNQNAHRTVITPSF
jgi:abhydrolase domain-containing protein 6